MRSVKKNYLYHVIYEFFVIAVPLIVSPYITRVLGPYNIGIYTFQLTVSSYFILFARLGIMIYGTRSIAACVNQEERNNVFSKIITLQFILSILTLFLYFVYVNFFVREFELIAMIMCVHFISSIFDISWFFFGIGEFRILVSRNIIFKIISTILIFVFVKVGSDLIIYVLILTVSQLFGHVITWPYLRGKIKYSYPKFRTITPIILPIVILFIPNVAVSLYKYIDKIMLGYYSPKDQLGYYEYASIIVGLPLGFITSLGTIMMPKSTELHRDGNTSKNLEYIRHSMIYSLGLSIAFSYGLAAISNTFVPFYFGDSFLPTSQLITGLALTLPFLSWANVIRTQYLIPKGKDKEYILSLFGGAAINLIINAILIPKYMAWGAVIGTIAAEITVCLIQTLIVKKDLPIKMYLMEGSGFILIGLLMLVVTNFINQMEISSLTRLVLMIVVGILIYLPLSLLYVKFGLKVRINNILK